MSLKFLLYPLMSLASWWQNMPLRIKGPIVIALPLTILLVPLSLLFLHEQQAALLEIKLSVALQNQRDIQTVHTQLFEASTAVRDYLLTGNKSFLTPYVRAKEKLPVLFSKLNRELNDVEQKERMNQIRPLADQNLVGLTKLANTNLEIDNQELVGQFNVQSETLNRLRLLIEEMSIRDAKLVEQDQKKVNVERQRNINLTMIAALAGILGTLGSAWVFSRTIVSRIRQIRDSAAHLARGEALILPSMSKDELGQLAHELDQAAKLLSKSVYAANFAKMQAQEANAEKSLFLSRTSHELRTPLNSILGFAQLLETDLTDIKQKNNATMIFAAGKHLLKLINLVLDIARIESGDMHIEIKPSALFQLLTEAAQLMEPLARIRDIRIQIECVPDLILATDRQKLLQVMLNLISNSIKYGPANATVKITAYVAENKVIIEFFDEGLGIPLPLRHRLFIPFDRLGAENTKTEGTGLGLALSRQMMTALGGSIHIAAEKSLFWLELPYADTQLRVEAPIATSFALQTIALSGKAKILYVEDNASNRALIEAIIARNRSCRLYNVATLKEARHFLAEITPDIILIDLNLPDGSGIRLVEFMQQTAQFAHIPILILSADAMPETIARLRQMGIHEYFTKPLDIALFNQTLNKLLSTENSK
jgi:signal transduction histidine kinase/ActR/RegA family two-component response regulator